MGALTLFVCLLSLTTGLTYGYGYNLNPFSPQSWAIFQRDLMESINKGDGARYTMFNNNLQITKGVKNFRPEEVRVKISNNNIVLEGVRYDDNGYVVDNFISQYSLPVGHRPENVVAEFSKSQHMLTITSKPVQEPDFDVPIKVVD